MSNAGSKTELRCEVLWWHMLNFDSHQACQVLMQVKQQIVLSATEAAEMLLRVDDIIKAGAAHLRSHLCKLSVH